MTTSFSVTKTGLAAAMAGCLAMVLLAGPVRADDKVLAKVNGSEIRQSDVALAEEELGPSLAQMDPATKDENVLAFLEHIPWGLGSDGYLNMAGTLLEKYDNSAIEVSASQALRLGANEPVPELEGMEHAVLPPPHR